MGSILLYIYIVQFLGQTMEFKTIHKVLAGIHSHTYAFLLKNEEELMIDEVIKTVKVSSVRTVDFYSNCVSLNRLCYLPDMAKTWPAYNWWDYE